MSDSPLLDIHDPREHYRKLLVDAFPALTRFLHTIYLAYESGEPLRVATANQALGVWIGQQMSEANKLGVAEGKEERDISEAVFRGALQFLHYEEVMDGTPEAQADLRTRAIHQARLLWDETRRATLEAQARVRAKHEAEAEALVRDFAKTLDRMNAQDVPPTKPIEP